MLTLRAVIQVAHRIHEWMGKKLQTYFKRDTECLNHNIWMISCMLIWCCCCLFLVLLVCLLVCLLLFFFMAFIVHGICPVFARVVCTSRDSPFLTRKLHACARASCRYGVGNGTRSLARLVDSCKLFFDFRLLSAFDSFWRAINKRNGDLCC